MPSRYEWIENLDIPRDQKDLLAYEIDSVKREPDYDLRAAVEYNLCVFRIEDIDNVLATIPGHNDEDNWYWVVSLKNGDYYYMTGGCDYTGWDCQSWLTVTKGKNPFDCAALAGGTYAEQLRKQLTGEQPWGLEVRNVSKD